MPSKNKKADHLHRANLHLLILVLHVREPTGLSRYAMWDPENSDDKSGVDVGGG